MVVRDWGKEGKGVTANEREVSFWGGDSALN